MASFGKVQLEVAHTAQFLFYVVGLVAASWHFAYGIWLFSAKWGIVSGDKAQKRLLRVCLLLFMVLCGAGFASLYSFRSRPIAEDEPNRAMLHSDHFQSDHKAVEQTTGSGRPVQ
jgi:succinate dehydrogenase / fumarate reductase cytochrome b subunit